jgi:hypothetical protein
MASESRALAVAKKEVERSKKRLSKLAKDNEASITRATRTAFTMGGALAMAYFKGRYPDRAEIVGLDASLVIGGGLTIAALMGWAGSQADSIESLGTGALAVYAGTKGYELGVEQQGS